VHPAAEAEALASALDNHVVIVTADVRGVIRVYENAGVAAVSY